MSDYRIRAHHGMCLAFFEGRGYSSEFTKHMGEMQELLAGNPRVQIIARTDDICACCPNNVAGVCTSLEKAAGYDRKVLSFCHLEEGMELEWHDFEKMVGETILKAGRRKEICGDCQWDYLCGK